MNNAAQATGCQRTGAQDVIDWRHASKLIPHRNTHTFI